MLAYRIWRAWPRTSIRTRTFGAACQEGVPGHERLPRGALVRQGGRKLYSTPLFLCLAAIVFADIAFAIASIPAAFAITRDPLLIWMGNVFALLGMRALFVLVESLIARFRYLDETIAIVLGLVGVKLLLEDLVKVGPLVSLGVIGVAFTVGILLSIRADRRDPEAEEKREQRMADMRQGMHEAGGDEDEDEDDGQGDGAERRVSRASGA